MRRERRGVRVIASEKTVGWLVGMGVLKKGEGEGRGLAYGLCRFELLHGLKRERGGGGDTRCIAWR